VERINNDKALLIRTRRPNLITERIENSRIIDQEGDIFNIAVKWGLGESQELAKLRILNVPSPIKRDYVVDG
jgi:hypothetical protein